MLLVAEEKKELGGDKGTIFGTRKTILDIWRVKRWGTEKVVEKFQ